MIVIGIVLLVAAGVAFFLARQERAKAHAATATETLTCGDVAALSSGVADEVGGGNFTQRCEAVGKAQPGPDGLFKGPDSGVDVVWAHTKVTHKYWEMRTVQRDNESHRERQEKQEVVSDITTITPFAIADETGSVLVHPDGGDVDRPEKVVDRFERPAETPTEPGVGGVLKSLLRSGSDSGTIGFQHEEWAIRPGARLYVQGEVADRTGALAFAKPADGKHFLISTRSEEEIVKGAEQKAMLLLGGSAVALVVGLVVLVLGVV